MKTLTAAEKLYEVETLMRAAVGLEQGLSLEGAEELSVDMQLSPMICGGTSLGLRVSCGDAELRIEADDFEALADIARAQAHRALAEAREANPATRAPRVSHLRLVISQ